MREYTEQYEVDASRLAYGTFNHQANREEGEGDIHSSYSGDTIATSSTVRRPFRFQGEMWICTGSGSDSHHDAYRLVDPRLFTRPTYTYGDKVKIQRKKDKYPGDFARHDPNGFYDGMKVKSSGKIMIMSGPCVLFTAQSSSAATTEVQLSLF